MNGKIRAREVRVIGMDGKQVGVLSLGEAISMARSHGVDLVEVAPNAAPPVCRLVDYGKYRYEQSKKDKEAKKHQHANRVKEVQLSPNIDPHDFAVKLGHAIDFLCEDMKVKITLKFRGREMAHQEFGFQVVEKFTKEIAIYGHPDAEPKLVGRGLTVMLSPLPRSKRPKHPAEAGSEDKTVRLPTLTYEDLRKVDAIEPSPAATNPAVMPPPAMNGRSTGFANNPFAQLDLNAAP